MNEDKHNPSNIIKFPTRCDVKIEGEEIHDAFDDWGDEFLEFEDWQVDYDLLERKEYVELLAIRKERVEKYPDNEYAQYYLGEAYMYTKQYIKGLHYLTSIHREQPERMDIQYLILDILFAIGKTEKDYDWLEEPHILKLSEDILKDCFDYLQGKKRPRSIDEIYSNFVYKGYLIFSRKELLKKLIEDDRFIIENPEDDFFAFIRTS